MDVDLSTVYVIGIDDEMAELRCKAHPKWWVDAHGPTLPVLIERATKHVKDDHWDGAQ